MNKLLPLIILVIACSTALLSFSELALVYRTLDARTSYLTPSMREAARAHPAKYTPLSRIPAPFTCAVIKQMTKRKERDPSDASDPFLPELSKALTATLVSESASTVKNMLISAVLRMVVSFAATKEAALEFYLNHLRVSSSVWGVEEAASLYFSKPLTELTPEEAILLGLLVGRASVSDLRTISSSARDDIAQSATNILDRMRDSGVMDDTDAKILARRTHSLLTNLSGIQSTPVKDEEVLSSGFKVFSTHPSQLVVQACAPSAERTHHLIVQTTRNELRIEAEPDPVDALPLRQALTATANHMGPEFLSVSTDERFLLLRDPLQHHVQLVVFDRVQQRVTASQSFGLKAFNPAWHPHENKLALALRIELNRYVLALWDISKNTTQNVIDVVSFSPPDLVWSPDGRLIAYTSTPKSDSPTELSIVSTLGTDNRRIGTIKRGATFSWSSDAQSLVYIATQSPGSITRLSLAQGASPLSLEIVQGECEGIATRLTPDTITPTTSEAPFKQPIDHAVSCRKKGTEYFNLFLVTLSPPRVVPLPTNAFADNGDLINPRWHSNGREIFFQHREGAQSNLILLRNASEVGRLAPIFTAFPAPGTSILMGSVADQPLVKWSDFSHPPQVQSWNIDQGVTKLRERSLLPTWITPSNVTRVPLKTPDNHTVMTYRWHARSTACSPSPSNPASKSSSVKRGVLVVTGGLRNQIVDIWNVAHGILSNFGVEVVSLNYRGATGRGASFENTPAAHIGRLEDILAAWRYMTTTLSIPGENISIVGIGYGGQLAVDLVSHDYVSTKIAPRQIVLISPSIVIPEPSIDKKLVAFKGSLSVFRGGWDRTDEKAIRKYIDARFPGIAASKPIDKQAANERFKWTIFFREGAGLQTTMSLAETVNSVLVGAGVSQVFSPYRPC